MDPGCLAQGDHRGPWPAHSRPHCMIPPQRPLRGLYAITSSDLCADRARLLAAVAAALRGGAAVIQLRDKYSAPAARSLNARALVALCREHGARLIINDDLALALDCGADGVHL